MFVSSLDNPNENKSVFWGASFILMSVSVLVQEMEVFEIRENGIQKGWNFFLWSDIETVAWDHLLYKEKLNIKIRGVDAIKQVKVPWDVHLAVADYIKQMYPVNS